MLHHPSLRNLPMGSSQHPRSLALSFSEAMHTQEIFRTQFLSQKLSLSHVRFWHSAVSGPRLSASLFLPWADPLSSFCAGSTLGSRQASSPGPSRTPVRAPLRQPGVQPRSRLLTRTRLFPPHMLRVHLKKRREAHNWARFLIMLPPSAEWAAWGLAGPGAPEADDGHGQHRRLEPPGRCARQQLLEPPASKASRACLCC